MKLTGRILNAIERSLSVHAASGPEDLTGYDDEESQDLHEDVCDAHEWVLAEQARREVRKAGRRKKGRMSA